MSTSLTYTHKPHAFAPETQWTLTPEGLSWDQTDKEKRSGTILYDDIKMVRIRYEPTRYERKRVGLSIHAGRLYHITNIGYGGVLDFVNQSESFNPFVMAFHNGFPSNSKTKFYKGSTWPAMIGNLVITIFVLLLLLFLAPIVSMTGIPGSTSIFRIILIVFFLPVLFILIKRNWPREYRPETFPEEMLTGET